MGRPLTPGERKALGKRASDYLDANNCAVVSWEYLEDLQRRAVVSYDKAHAEKQISTLVRQVIEMGETNARLSDELRETAAWKLTGECKACRMVRGCPDCKWADRCARHKVT